MTTLEKRLAEKDAELKKKIEKGEIKVCAIDKPGCDSCGS